MNYTTTIRIVEANGWPVQGATVEFGLFQKPSVKMTTDANGQVYYKYENAVVTAELKVTAYGFKTYDHFHDLPINSRVDIVVERDDTKFFAGWTRVRNAETREAISGVMLYVGDKPAGPSDDSGRIWVIGPLGKITVRAVRNTTPKIDDKREITTVAGQGFPAYYDLKLDAPVARKLTLKTTPGGTSLTVKKQDGTVLETVVCDDKGCAQTTQAYADGQISVDAAKEGYTTKNTPVNVAAPVNEYPVQGPVLEGDGSQGSQEGTSDPKDTQSGEDDATSNGTTAVAASDRPVPATEDASQYDYEWIFPNSSDGKYFTTTQARMYVGNLFIDELNTVQFAYQGNRIPLYGYCSEDMDAVGSGKRLVQGQILVNFISEGYLYTVLNEHKRVLQDAQAKIAKAKDEFEAAKQRLAQLQTRREEIIGDINRVPLRLVSGGNGEANDYQAEELERIDEEIARLAAIHGPEVVDAAKLVLAGRDRLKTKANPITLKIPFDIVLELEGGGRTVTRKLENCVLTSNEQIYDQSGATLLDAYGFIARRLI